MSDTEQNKYGPRRLTESYIKGLKWDGKPRFIRDTEVRGLFVAINKNNVVYKIQADLWVGEAGRKKFVRTVRNTYGDVHQWSLKSMRQTAYEAICQIKNGIDPFREAAVATLNSKTSKWSSENPVNWSVGDLLERYRDDLVYRDASENTLRDIDYSMNNYLRPWSARPALEIKKSDARRLHRSISENHGKIAANHAMRHFRAAYNYADRECDGDEFGANPVRAVQFHRERKAERVLLPDELKSWREDLFRLTNPIRREMHLLELLSGLRPKNVMEIEKDWVDTKNRAIKFPKMKSRRAFHLPLSTQMVDCTVRAWHLSDMLFPGSKWLFPTILRKTGEVGHASVIREKSMPSQTGHILRHTHRNIAKIAKVDDISAKLLLDHTIPGIDGVYLHDVALFGPLLEFQQLISNKIFELMRIEYKNGKLVIW